MLTPVTSHIFSVSKSIIYLAISHAIIAIICNVCIQEKFAENVSILIYPTDVIVLTSDQKTMGYDNLDNTFIHPEAPPLPRRLDIQFV